MKKVIFSILLVCCFCVTAMAQPRAIGARIGYNMEFSYQHALLTRNMIDLSVGASNVWNQWGYVEADCIFDWVFTIKGRWHWYVGPGAGFGYGYGAYWHYYDYTPFRVNVGGQIGLEYCFKIPLNLSFDWRPMINLMGFHQSNYPMEYNFYNFALGVRYRF